MNLTDANRLWTAILGELSLQMTRATFDTWLRGSCVIAYDPPALTVHVRHQYAIEWLEHRLMALMERTTRRRFPPDTTIQLTSEAHAPDALTAEAPADTIGAGDDAGPAPGPIDVDSDPTPAPIPRAILNFDPNTADSGGFSMIGNYANNFWAPYLGTVAWRIYTLVYAADKRGDKGKHEFTRPRSMSISALSRAVPASRNAIRGRWRPLPSPSQGEGREYSRAGEGSRGEGRVWRQGAFDVLTVEGIARIEWHDQDPHWRRWFPGGPAQHSDAAGQRYIYRIAVRTTLPLLTPRQVAALPADMRTAHETYLVTQQIDVVLWDQIRQSTLLPVDKMIITGVRTPVTGATAPVSVFFGDHTGTQDE